MQVKMVLASFLCNVVTLWPTSASPVAPKHKAYQQIDEKEHMAIIFAIEQWRFYLQHSEFIIYTDQKSLIHLNK